MHTHLRKIGNSKGIIIPADFLESCSLNDEVELRIEGKCIVIEALKKHEQAGLMVIQRNR